MNNLQIDPGELLRNPDLFFHTIDLDGDAAWFARMDAESYRKSSFLDERIVRARPEPLRLPLSALRELIRQAGARALNSHYIFHVGHCGSTLLARILDDVRGFFVLREPMVLRVLSELRDETTRADGRLDQSGWKELFAAASYMLSRRYADSDTAVIKATSICGNLLRPSLDAHADNRAILLSVTLDVYLATMLRPQRRPELGANGRLRIRQLHSLTGREELRLYEMSDSQMAVMNWLTAMASFMGVVSDPELGRRAKLVDFDALLDSRAEQLADIIAFLGRELDEAERSRLGESAHFSSYAKNPERVFDAGARAAQLEECRQQAADEIAAGLAWARELCDNSKALSGMGAWLEAA